MAMSSRVAVMNKGRIEQIDVPSRIFHEPANEFVYTFIGESCCLPVRITSAKPQDRAGQPIDLKLEQKPAEGEWRFYIRPSRLKLAQEAASAPNRLSAQIHFIEFLGDFQRYHLKSGALELFSDHRGATGHKVGDMIDIGWNSGDMQAFR
jgi:ABC-type Fe3+/spermidine/putrescine transport system ATPase subunit